MIRLHVFLLFGLIVCFNCANCSLTCEEDVRLPVTLNYEGRFSKIELSPGFEILDAHESLIKCKRMTGDRIIYIFCTKTLLDNNTISAVGRGFICDLLCKVKAASSAVIVPSNEETISTVEPFWLKQKLMKDFNKIPIEAFTANAAIFEATIRMIEYNLFYRIGEYTRLFAEFVDNFSSGIEVPPLFEKAWNPILKPVHLILNKLVRSRKSIGKIEPSFIGALVQLISSPIGEESEMTSSLIKYILLNNRILGNSIISALDGILERGICGDAPVIIIEPILKFIGTNLFHFRNDLESPITIGLIKIMTQRIIPLYAHPKFHWFLDSYSHALIEYLSFFEVSSDMRIKRSSFDPVFPVVSPFQESETVIILRHALLSNDDYINVNPAIDRLNLLSRYEVMIALISYQFYPRYMVPEIFEVIRVDFVKHNDKESALNLYILLSKSEIFSGNDEVASIIRRNIPALKPILNIFEKKEKDHEMEMKTICHRIQEQIELIPE